jgi:hypothetical protein
MRFKYNMPWKMCLSRFVSVVLCCTRSGETVVKLFVHRISVNSLPSFTNSYIQLQSIVGRFFPEVFIKCISGIVVSLLQSKCVIGSVLVWALVLACLHKCPTSSLPPPVINAAHAC